MNEEKSFANVLSKEGRITVTQDDINAAKAAEMSLSQFLDNKYLDNAQYRQGLDAFDAALLTGGIIVRGDVSRGIESSTMEKFFTTTPSNRLLFPEFMVRTIKQTVLEQPITQYLIGEVQTITGDTRKQPELDLSKEGENRKKLKHVRIAELSEIPTITIKLGETAISLYKYGRAVSASYEVLRRTTIDMFRKTIELIARFIAESELVEVLRVIEEGDGNKNPAKVYKRSELNAAGNAGVLDDITLLKYLMAQYPFAFDTVVVNEDLYIQLVSSKYDGSLRTGLTDKAPFTFPQGIFEGLTILYCEDLEDSAAGNPRLFGLKRSMAIIKIIEQGSMIQELEKYASNQSEKMFITENVGFGKIYNEASAILELD